MPVSFLLIKLLKCRKTILFKKIQIETSNKAKLIEQNTYLLIGLDLKLNERQN